MSSLLYFIVAADIITATDIVNDNSKAKVENTKRQKYNNYLGSDVIILHQVSFSWCRWSDEGSGPAGSQFHDQKVLSRINNLIAATNKLLAGPG